MPSGGCGGKYSYDIIYICSAVGVAVLGWVCLIIYVIVMVIF